ncbi:RrF2 family transcriptional regulator [Novosphingobium rosa]|uniref:RrF2 family transcriptional regulator n=1 Tax=Novosphingobium rosa TaxID=76978 RepID=UPI000835F8D5|nr:Rrf2 family transcriptional regulator [Novosphingobium rosa]
MAHITTSVEYGIHCLLWLVGNDNRPVSSRDLAELQGVSPSFLAKIFPRLEKAGIVKASEGVRGGYLLARPADRISFLDVVDAIEGEKPLFDCQEVRGRCAVFGAQAPGWATAGTCAIHAVMLQAEKAMRDTLASQTLASVGERFMRKAPPAFADDVNGWISDRVSGRATRGGRPARDVPD